MSKEKYATNTLHTNKLHALRPRYDLPRDDC